MKEPTGPGDIIELLSRMSVKRRFSNDVARRTIMNWTRYYQIVAFLVLFVFGVHIFTWEQQVGFHFRHKRDTSSQAQNGSTVLSGNSSDPVHNINETSSAQPVPGISDVTKPSQNVSNAPIENISTEPMENSTATQEGPSQTTKSPQSAVSVPNVHDNNRTKVPNNVTNQDVITEMNAQVNTADNLKPSVINTTLSSVTQPAPYVELTTEDTVYSTEESVVIVPPSKAPSPRSSTVISETTSLVIVKGDGNEDGSLNLLAIVLPIAIFLVLIIVLIACICCRHGHAFCHYCRKRKTKRRKEDGNDLWVEHGGIDNVAVVNDDDELTTEKNSEVDNVVISAQIYGGKLYEVDYGFEASEDSHLGLAPGSIVEVVEKLDSGWWRGYVGEREGWFPATYVHTLDKHQQSPDTHSAVNQGFDVEEELNKLQQEKSDNGMPARKESENVESSPVSLQDKLIKAITQEVGKKNQYVAIADYTAVNPDEISISRGDSLIHMNKDPSGWTRVKRDGTAETGWVPSSYLQQNTDGDEVFLDDESKIPLTMQLEEEYYDEDELDETVDWEAEFDEDQDELTGIEHTAIHAYEAKQEGDLSFETGDTVIVFEMLAGGWWRGCSSGQEGWFPATYVEAVAQTPRESGDLDDFKLSLVLETKRVSIQTEKNIEYPDLGTSSLERRVQADRKEKEKDPLYSPRSISQDEKPVVPVRFVTPKLVRVNRGTLKRSAHKLKRPRRPAPPPPAGVEPYRTLTKHSLPRRKRKPPPPPKRKSPIKTYPSPPPPPPQRRVALKLIIPKSVSSSNMSSTISPVQSPGGDSAPQPSKPTPTRPAPPTPSAILEARKQSIGSIGSTRSVIPPPLMFMDTFQKEKKEGKTKQMAPPKPAKRTSIQLNKMSESDVEKITAQPPSENSTSMNSLDRYSSIDSKGSGSSWGQGSSLDKRDRPVMAVKPVMKFVQGDAWKEDIKRSSTSMPHNSNISPDGKSVQTSSANISGPVSANTMWVAPQPQNEQYKSQPKTRPNPPPRKSISQSIIPLQEIQPHSPVRGRQDSRPSTSSTDSGKPAPPRPPPPRPTGPPEHSGVIMRRKNNDTSSRNAARRKSTLRRAAHSYHSTEKGHLSFHQDSFIKELGEAPGKPGWMLGMLADGTTGIYPGSSVEEITQGVRVSRV